jgi:hypothetical protein
MYIVFIRVKTKQMSAFTVHDVSKIARFTHAPCIFIFGMILRKKNRGFSIALIGFYNRNGVFTARYGLKLEMEFKSILCFDALIAVKRYSVKT